MPSPTAEIPQLPPTIKTWTVRRTTDQADVQVITVSGAAKVAGVPKRKVEEWIGQGLLAICYTPDSDVRVYVDRLWALLQSFPTRRP